VNKGPWGTLRDPRLPSHGGNPGSNPGSGTSKARFSGVSLFSREWTTPSPTVSRSTAVTGFAERTKTWYRRWRARFLVDAQLPPALASLFSCETDLLWSRGSCSACFRLRPECREGQGFPGRIRRPSASRSACRAALQDRGGVPGRVLARLVRGRSPRSRPAE
jgi:hypothetical protein